LPGGREGFYTLGMAMRKFFVRSLLLSITAVVVIQGCANLDAPYDPYYGNQPPSGSYGNGGYYGGGPYYGSGPNYGGSSYYDRRERERLEEERRRLERERERLERERDRQNSYRPPPPPPAPRPPASYDRCPAGFSPSENKCSKEERKRGCKDIRMPSGLGCVHR
jgi:hypothetical protein